MLGYGSPAVRPATHEIARYQITKGVPRVEGCVPLRGFHPRPDSLDFLPGGEDSNPAPLDDLAGVTIPHEAPPPLSIRPRKTTNFKWPSSKRVVIRLERTW
jgi:hypothetical protein